MKKILSLFLAFVLCLSMCSCGKNDTQESQNTELESSVVEEPSTEKITDEIIGSWEYTYTATENGLTYNAGDTLRQVLVFYKGGTGVHEYYNHPNGKLTGNPSFTWEVQEDVVNIQHTDDGWLLSFIFDPNTDTLTWQQYSWEFIRIK